jgi:hypothetical protein
MFFLALAASWLIWLARQAFAFRHAAGERRLQLKWLLSGAAVGIILAAGGCCWPPGCFRSGHRSRWRPRRWRRPRCSIRCATGCSGWWTVGSTGPGTTPDTAVAAFAARLQDAVDLDAVRDDLVRVVTRSLEPAHLSVSMRESR